MHHDPPMSALLLHPHVSQPRVDHSRCTACISGPVSAVPRTGLAGPAAGLARFARL